MEGRPSAAGVTYVDIAPATDSHPRNDSASIVRLDDGSLFMVWIEMHASPFGGHDEAPSIGAYPVYLTADRTKFFLPRVVADFYRDWVLADPGQQYTLRPHRWDILNETGLATVRARVGATLETLFNEFFFKAITGDIDAATEWDAYVAEWRKVGGDQVIAELEKAPIVSEFRQGRLTY